jgi:uncharacterized membrane protein
MLAWIFGFVIVIILVSVYFTSLASPQPNIRIGVSLPREVLKSAEIEGIVKMYRNSILRLVLIAAVGSVPLFFLLSYVSITTLYLFMWMGLLFYACNRIFTKYHRKLLELKQGNRWFGSKARIVSIDTEVSRLKNTMPISGKWFILPALLSLLPFLFAFLNKNADVMLLSLGSLAVVNTLVSIWLYRLVYNERTVFFSEDTSVNMAYNTVRKSTLSRGWLMFALLESAVVAIICFIIWQFGMAVILAVCILLVVSLFGILIIFGAYQSVQGKQQRLKDAKNNDVYIDDDSGWENGFMFYNNPYDERTMVEKRSGYGYTINIASRGGKAFIYGTFGFLALIIIGTTAISFWADFGEVEMTMISENNTIEIQAPMYGYQFNAEDIIGVDMIDDIPSGLRTNGVSTERYALGNFNIDGYGKSKLYITRNAPYIVIELDGLYVFINGETEEQTQEYYNQLQALEGE